MLVRFYRRVLSPLKPAPTCRFYPSCSAYAEEALEVHGPLVGSWLAVRRILKCQPFHRGGLDPVPTQKFGKNFYKKDFHTKAQGFVATALEEK